VGVCEEFEGGVHAKEPSPAAVVPATMVPATGRVLSTGLAESSAFLVGLPVGY